MTRSSDTGLRRPRARRPGSRSGEVEAAARRAPHRLRVAVFAPRHGDTVVAAILAAVDCEVEACRSARACVDAVRDADVLVINGASYDDAVAEAVRNASRLRWVQFLSSGTDATVRHGGLRPGTIVTNAAEALGPVVAEHAMALALALIRSIPALEEAKRQRTWAKDAVAKALASLDGACVVIIGYGAIGRALAVRATAFGARCIVVRRSRRDPDPLPPGVAFAELDAALPRADILFIAIPLNDETKGLIDRRRLALLPRHASVVNVARGAIIDMRALVDALREGRIASAALDVFDEEPLPSDSRLWSLRNVIISPHIAGHGGRRVAERMAAICVRNLQRFVAGTLASPRA